MMAPVMIGGGDVLDRLSYNLQPKLDLHNFEDPRYEDGKYVLTSPRSLEACSRLNIKPVELLYKPLSEFQEELLPCDVALRSIFNIYDDHEQNRQRKLRRCREERRRIIADDLDREPASVIVYKEPAYSHQGPGGDGSVQRERTKWVSSIGHDRISRQELDTRAKQLYSDSYRARTVGSKTISHTKRKKLRSKKGDNSVSNRSESSSRSLRSQSLTLTKSCGNLDNSQPIANPKLRRHLSHSNLESATSIPKRDQKILELMVSKGEEEKKRCAERNAANLSWDEDRKRQIAIQNDAERRRRQMLSRERSEWEAQRDQLALERSRLDESTRQARERRLDSKLSRSQSNLNQTLRSKALQLEDKKRKEYHRKKAQENNRESLTQDELEMRDLVNDKQRRDISEAVRRREARLSMNSMRKSLENSEKEAEYRRRMVHLQAADSVGKDNLRASIDAKHAQATEKYEQVRSRRDLQLTLSQQEREKKQRQAELSQKLQEHEMEEWRKSLCSYRQSLAERASQSLNRTNQLKAERTARERREKQQLQKANIRRVAEELEAWRRSTERHLVEKDRRVDEIQTEREASIQQTRATAHTTEVMREKLREKYAADSFDKKVLKAEIFNKIGHGLLGKTDQGMKNRSKVKLAYM